MPSSLRSCAPLLTSALLLCTPALAFNTPLSDQAVREAYFLGQRRDESMAAFLNKYTKLLPPPKTGPNISSVTFLTPFALLVEYSSRQSNYSAQQAALDHKSQDEAVEISIDIFLTPSYGAFTTPPTHSRSGSPLGIQMRPSDFWKTFQFRVFDGDEEITTDDLTGQPHYSCSDDGCFSPAPPSTCGFPPWLLRPIPPRLKSLRQRATASPSTLTCPPSADLCRGSAR